MNPSSHAPLFNLATRSLALVASFVVGCSVASSTPPPVAAQSAPARVRVADRTHFARAPQAREILGTRDGFVAALSPLDRALRLSSTAAIDEATFLAFVARQASDWTQAEEDRVRRALAHIDTRIDARGLGLGDFLPREVVLVKTTGQEEFGLPYTRANAIILPASSLARADDDVLAGLLEHELFHVLSRQSPALREGAYRLIGFERASAVPIPREIEPVRITNPDGYQSDFRLPLRVGGDVVPVVPLLVSKRPAYDPALGNFVMKYVDFKLMVAEPAGGKTRTLEPGEDYLRCVGRNTEEIIHPDEIMAENFVRVLARGDATHEREPTPELVDDFEGFLRSGRVPAAKERCRF